MNITNLNHLENIIKKHYSSKNIGGNAISLSTINGFAEGMNYTNVVAKGKVIAISLPNYQFSQSFSSVSSSAI